jgi:hypothetical protein
MVKEIEQRVQSLSGVLASPVGEDDHAEKGRRVELRRFVHMQTHIKLLIPLSGNSRGLLRSSNHSPNNMCFSRFLHNVKNAKTLAGVVQELANAITDYQV